MKNVFTISQRIFATITANAISLAGAVLVGFGLRIINFNAKAPQLSEIIICYTAIFKHLGDLLVYLKGVNQNLLYISSLHFWFMLLGHPTILAGRSLALIAGVFTIIITFSFVKELFDRKTAVITAWLVALSPLLIINSRVIEGYSYACLVVLISEYFFVRAFVSREKSFWNIIAYVFFAVLRHYGHPYHIGLPVAEGIFLLSVYRENPRCFWKWFYANLCVAVALVPNLILILHQLANQSAALSSEYIPTFWKPEIGLKKILFALPSLLSGFGYLPISRYNAFFIKYLKLINLAMIMFLYACALRREKGRESVLNAVRYVLFLSIVPLLCIFPMAFLSYGHFINAKYFTFVAPYFCTVLGVGIMQCKSTLRKIVLVLIVVAAFLSAVVYLVILPQREIALNWQQIAPSIRNELKEDDILLVFPNSVMPGLSYGTEGSKVLPMKGLPEDFEISTLSSKSIRMADPTYAGYIDKLTEGRKRIWLLTCYEGSYDPENIIISHLEKNFIMKRDTVWHSSNGDLILRLYERR